jgi:hypothetical protein
MARSRGATRAEIRHVFRACSASERAGSGSVSASVNQGRLATATGSSSPARAWSMRILRMTGLGPTAVKTVGRATPAAAAMSSIEVAR